MGSERASTGEKRPRLTADDHLCGELMAAALRGSGCGSDSTSLRMRGLVDPLLFAQSLCTFFPPSLLVPDDLLRSI